MTCTAAKLHSYVQQLNLLNTGRLSWWRELGCEGSTGLKCSLQTGNEIGASPRVSRTQGRHPATQICVERLCCFLGKRNVATCGNCMIHPTPKGRDLNSPYDVARFGVDAYFTPPREEDLSTSSRAGTTPTANPIMSVLGRTAAYHKSARVCRLLQRVCNSSRCMERIARIGKYPAEVSLNLHLVMSQNIGPRRPKM